MDCDFVPFFVESLDVLWKLNDLAADQEKRGLDVILFQKVIERRTVCGRAIVKALLKGPDAVRSAGRSREQRVSTYQAPVTRLTGINVFGTSALGEGPVTIRILARLLSIDELAGRAGLAEGCARDGGVVNQLEPFGFGLRDGAHDWIGLLPLELAGRSLQCARATTARRCWRLLLCLSVCSGCQKECDLFQRKKHESVRYSKEGRMSEIDDVRKGQKTMKTKETVWMAKRSHVHLYILFILGCVWRSDR